MRQKHWGLFTLLAGLMLLGLAWGSMRAWAQNGDNPIVQLKAQAWASAGLSQTPPLPPGPIVSSQPPDTRAALAQAYWSQIAFQSYRDGNWEIYWMNQYGANQTRFTYNPASDVRPRLSPDLTEIVFSSYRDGNWEIYKMKTDGTGLQRLTNNGADDVHPAWSPDGRYITFSHKKGDEWSIYRMNADGSGQWRLTNPGDTDDFFPTWSPDGNEIAWVRRGAWGYGDLMVMQANGNNPTVLRSHLRFLQNPVWSPDGQYIACDADTDGDDWNQLVIYRRSDGWRRWEDYGRGSLKDAWMGSWSPDGKELLFSLIKYVVQDNKLYISETRVKAIHIDSRNERGFMGTNLDMAPDWQQGIDHQPPTAHIDPLPEISPAPIPLQWSGVDAGPAGVVSYDVQVRENGGDWQNWLQATPDTSAEYPGWGGRQYAFRVRARDDAGNLSDWATTQTTVEALPPHSAFDPIPPFMRSRGTITWHGQDEGGSGIASYNVQYRPSDTQDWLTWLQETPQTQASIPGQVGKSYYFRVQAIDRAHNVGPWTETTSATILYYWGISGAIFDNRHRPIPQASVSSTPPGKYGGRSDATGAYYLYTTTWWSDSLQVQWQKPGYGPLPVTAYPPTTDAHTDVALPPPDNVLQNPSFEITAGDTGWQRSGVFPPVDAADSRHTGALGQRLGLMTFNAGYAQIETPGDAMGIHLFIDEHGGRHFYWHNQNNELYYQHIAVDGARGPIKRISLGAASNAQVRISKEGVVHVTWLDAFTNYRYPFYAVRTPDGVWQQRKLDVKDRQQTAIDDQGTLHILFPNAKRYQQRRADGVWTALEETPPIPGIFKQMAAAPDGTLYILYQHDKGTSFVMRTPNGQWQTGQSIPGTPGTYDAMMRIDAHNTLHFLARKGDRIIYTRLEPNGAWSEKGFTVPSTNYYTRDLFIDDDGGVHIIVAQNNFSDIDLFYRYGAADGAWSEVETQVMPREISQGLWSDPTYLHFALDGQKRLYMVGARKHLIAGLRDSDGHWDFWTPSRSVCQTYVSGSDAKRMVAIAIDARKDIAHIAWSADSTCDIITTNTVSGSGGDSRLQQRVTLAAAPNAPTLSFFYRYHAPLPSPAALNVRIDGATIFSTTVAATAWTHQWLDMSDWAGQTVTVTFDITQVPGAYTTWADIDDVSLGSSAYPDLWLAAQPAQRPTTGQTLTLRVPYGNSGDIAAAGAAITLTWPAELTLVGLDPPASAHPTAHSWRWDVGTLSPGPAAAGTLTLTARVPEIAAGQTLSGTLRIASPGVELAPENNERILWFFVDGQALYLPMITSP